MAMTRRLAYRRLLTGAMTIAALIVNMPAATAQPAEAQARISAAMDEAIKGLDSSPRVKKLSPQAKKQLLEFVVGNTMFVMAHEMGRNEHAGARARGGRCRLLCGRHRAQHAFRVFRARAVRGGEGLGAQQLSRQEAGKQAKSCAPRGDRRTKKVRGNPIAPDRPSRVSDFG
jgi:hypothetical protein